jgi:ABC-2 type transport system permease protein
MVAVREIKTRVLTRAFVIGNAVFLLLIVGSLTLTAVLLDDPGKPIKVAVVGEANELSASLEAAGERLKTRVLVRELATPEAARAAVVEGDVKVVLLREEGGYVARADKRLSPALQALLTSAVQQRAVAEALTARDIDPEVLAEAASGARLDVRFERPPKKDADQRTALSFAVVGLLYLQLIGNGIAVATGVVEGKVSRVVELLLAAIKPLHLLAGKVLGIGVVGLIQLAAYGVVGLTMGAATGLVDLTGPAVVAFVSTLGWYVLGYLFLGMLYAAAGSMVSRQEEVGSATAALSVLVIAMFAVAQASVSDPNGDLSNIMSWIPPFSAILMPLRVASGVTGPGQILGTAALMLATTSVLAVGAARIYQASILRTGSGFSLRRKAAAKTG